MASVLSAAAFDFYTQNGAEPRTAAVFNVE
jgi:hypothetical protein